MKKFKFLSIEDLESLPLKEDEKDAESADLARWLSFGRFSWIVQMKGKGSAGLQVRADECTVEAGALCFYAIVSNKEERALVCAFPPNEWKSSKIISMIDGYPTHTRGLEED